MRLLFRRYPVAGLAAVLVAVALGVVASIRPIWLFDRPFDVVSPSDAVLVSSDARSLEIYWSPETFRVAYPAEGLGAFDENATGARDAGFAFFFSCRPAVGEEPGVQLGRYHLDVALLVPMHPSEDAVYSSLNPLSWIMFPADSDVVIYPVRVSIAEIPPFDADLLRFRTHASEDRAPLRLDLTRNVSQLLVLLRSGAWMPVLVVSDGVVDVEALFPPRPDLYDAAGAMLAQCY